MTIMSAVAGAILVAFGLFLVGLTVVVFAKPAVAERFFMAFASSARTHYTEQIVRRVITQSTYHEMGQAMNKIDPMSVTTRPHGARSRMPTPPAIKRAAGKRKIGNASAVVRFSPPRVNTPISPHRPPKIREATLMRSRWDAICL